MSKLKRVLFDKTDREFEKLMQIRVSENTDKDEITKQQARVKLLFEILLEQGIMGKYRNKRFEDISQND